MRKAKPQKASNEISKPRQHPSIYSIPPEEQEKYLNRERIILECIAVRTATGGRLPRGERTKAAQELRISNRMVDILIDTYLAYREAYPDQPGVNAFVPIKTGPIKQRKLTDEQAKVALYAFLNPSWITMIEDGPIKEVSLIPTVELVQRLLVYLWPDINISMDYLRKFLTTREKQNKALFTLAREGEKSFWEQFVMKKTNNVLAPNIRWQSDARPLPVYIRHEGVICTVTLISIIDDNSRYAIKWMVLPRKVMADDKTIKRVDFTADDARALLIGAILETGVRPWINYTDNGVQYKALLDRIQFLTEPTEPPIHLVFSKPGRPQGRGKIEVFQKLVDRALKGSPGYIEQESQAYWWHKWQEIQKAPEKLDNLDELIRNIDTYFRDDWNAKPMRGQKKSRRELWMEGLATSLPAPSLERCVAFAAIAWKTASVSPQGVYYNDIYYQPIAEGGHNRVKQAINQSIKVPFYMFRVGTTERARASFDGGHTWEDVVPSTQQSMTTHEYVEAQEALVRETKKELEAGFEEYFAFLTERYGWKRPGFVRGSRTILPGEAIKEKLNEQQSAKAPSSTEEKRPRRKQPSERSRNESPPAPIEKSNHKQITPASVATPSDTTAEDQAREALQRYQQLWDNQAKLNDAREAKE